MVRLLLTFYLLAWISTKVTVRLYLLSIYRIPYQIKADIRLHIGKNTADPEDERRSVEASRRPSGGKGLDLAGNFQIRLIWAFENDKGLTV
jgi:hypothetical protein